MAWYDEKDMDRDFSYDGCFFKTFTEEEKKAEKEALEAAVAVFAAAGLPAKPVKEHDESTRYEICPGVWIFADFELGYMFGLRYRVFIENNNELNEFLTRDVRARILKEMQAEPTDLVTRGSEFIKITKDFLIREKNWINEYNKKIEKIYSLIKNNPYRYIKIATGVNNRTKNPNFQVYLDRDNVNIKTDQYGLHKGLKTLNGEYIEAKNVRECGTMNEKRQKEYNDILYRLKGSTTHKYEMGQSFLCQLIKEYIESNVGWEIEYGSKVCIFLKNKYV